VISAAAVVLVIALALVDHEEPADSHFDIVFDGPPGSRGGRFVGIEDATGKSTETGHWMQRPDGRWVLRISRRIDIEHRH